MFSVPGRSEWSFYHIQFIRNKSWSSLHSSNQARASIEKVEACLWKPDGALKYKVVPWNGESVLRDMRGSFTVLQTKKGVKTNTDRFFFSPLVCFMSRCGLSFSISFHPSTTVLCVSLSPLFRFILFQPVTHTCHRLHIKQHATPSEWRKSSGGPSSLLCSAPRHLAVTPRGDDQSNWTPGWVAHQPLPCWVGRVNCGWKTLRTKWLKVYKMFQTLPKVSLVCCA